MKIQEVQRENRRLKRRLKSTSVNLESAERELIRFSEERKAKMQTVPFLNGVISELRNEKSALKGEVRRLTKELSESEAARQIMMHGMEIKKELA